MVDLFSLHNDNIVDSGLHVVQQLHAKQVTPTDAAVVHLESLHFLFQLPFENQELLFVMLTSSVE